MGTYKNGVFRSGVICLSLLTASVCYRISFGKLCINRSHAIDAVNSIMLLQFLLMNRDFDR